MKEHICFDISNAVLPGIPVADYAAGLSWYQRLLGEALSFFPNDREAVWELAPHRYVYIVQRPEHAGHAVHLSFVDNLDMLVAQIADRGLDPVERETYPGGVRKITYRDPDVVNTLQSGRIWLYDFTSSSPQRGCLIGAVAGKRSET